MARTWLGSQCSRHPKEGCDLCGVHRNLPHGRMDGPIPDGKLKDFEQKRQRSKTCDSGKSCDSASKDKQSSVPDNICPPVEEKEGAPVVFALDKIHSSDTAARKTKKRARTPSGIHPPLKLKNHPKTDSLQASAKQEAVKLAPVPYGANFCRQDLKRRGRSSASAGVSKLGKQLGKYYGKDGRLKPQYTRTDVPTGEFNMRMGRFSKFRHRQALKDLAVAERSLVIHSKQRLESFSSTVTPDLLSMMPRGSLGDIALVRPPDAVVNTPPSGFGEGDHELRRSEELV